MRGKLTMAIVAVFIVGLLSGPADAITIDGSPGISGTWSNPVGGTNITYQSASVGYGNGTQDQVRWGETNGVQSGLGFTGNNTPITVTVDEIFEIGQLCHFNEVVETGTAASAVDLTLSMAFTDPSGESIDALFTFEIDETPNTVWPPSSEENNDFITFPTAFSEESITVDDPNNGTQEVVLELVGFGPADDELLDEFETVEGTTTCTLIWGQFTEAPPSGIIPEPSTVFLLSSGVMGLGLLLLKRRNAA